MLAGASLARQGRLAVSYDEEEATWRISSFRSCPSVVSWWVPRRRKSSSSAQIVYTGEFLHGRRSGTGQWTEAGRERAGEWVDGMLNGAGIERSKEGTTVIANFLWDRAHGAGVKMSRRRCGCESLEGNFEDGQLVGLCVAGVTDLEELNICRTPGLMVSNGESLRLSRDNCGEEELRRAVMARTERVVKKAREREKEAKRLAYLVKTINKLQRNFEKKLQDGPHLVCLRSRRESIVIKNFWIRYLTEDSAAHPSHLASSRRRFLHALRPCPGGCPDSTDGAESDSHASLTTKLLRLDLTPGYVDFSASRWHKNVFMRQLREALTSKLVLVDSLEVVELVKLRGVVCVFVLLSVEAGDAFTPRVLLLHLRSTFELHGCRVLDLVELPASSLAPYRQRLAEVQEEMMETLAHARGEQVKEGAEVKEVRGRVQEEERRKSPEQQRHNTEVKSKRAICNPLIATWRRGIREGGGGGGGKRVMLGLSFSDISLSSIATDQTERDATFDLSVSERSCGSMEDITNKRDRCDFPSPSFPSLP
uniref:Uncharacterized protein n=1 Tax=Guillardia theta TaxID=55529 RepID=A0A7S4M112_GUITH|mmetsp:Transcript_1289/g.3963  ORF Transcript_1289/g.3963 Transcript_1289/m.3963 type:complete len:536 (+) Transcript_1289:478-2085(+)